MIAYSGTTDERQADGSSDGVAGPTEETAESGRQNSDVDETADCRFSRRDLLVGSGFLALGAGAGVYWLNDSDDPPSASEPDSEQTDADEDGEPVTAEIEKKKSTPGSSSPTTPP